MNHSVLLAGKILAKFDTYEKARAYAIEQSNLWPNAMYKIYYKTKYYISTYVNGNPIK